MISLLGLSDIFYIVTVFCVTLRAYFWFSKERIRKVKERKTCYYHWLSEKGNTCKHKKHAVTALHIETGGLGSNLSHNNILVSFFYFFA